MESGISVAFWLASIRVIMIDFCVFFVLYIFFLKNFYNSFVGWFGFYYFRFVDVVIERLNNF